MPLITFEFPAHEIVKMDIHPDTPLLEVCRALGLESEHILFFCGRYKGEIGTLMGPGYSMDPFGKFNTNECAIIDKRNL